MVAAVGPFDCRDYPVDTVLAVKGGHSVSVCIPARNEEATVGHVVEQVLAAARGERAIADEVVVIDDFSEDRTGEVARSAGAKVVRAPGPGATGSGSGSGSKRTMAGNDGQPGKGAAMRLGLQSTSGEIVVFLDADVVDIGPHFVSGLVGPLLRNPALRLTKATYRRYLDDRPGEGGRVTELVAKPLIELLYPELTFLDQPLSGECAGWREVFGAVDFPHGYGVELATIIEVARLFGPESIGQVDLGSRRHRNRPWHELVPIAREVCATALQRAPEWRGAPGLIPRGE